MGLLPTCLLLGAPRAGTTALHHWLGSHPDVCVARPKETHFFGAHFNRGLGHYQQFFAHHRDEPAVVDCTPSNLALPYVPERIAKTLPDVSLVAVLREPVQQAHSSWWKIYSMGADRRSFAAAVEQELRDEQLSDAEVEARWLGMLAATDGGRPVTHSLYLDSGYYLDSLTRYAEVFGPEQLHVFLHDDLRRDPAGLTSAIASVLGVDATRAPDRTPPHVNEASGRLTSAVRRATRRLPDGARRTLDRAARRVDRTKPPRLDPGLARALATHFARRNRGLSDFIGRDVSAWESSADAQS